MSIVLSDGPVPVSKEITDDKVAFHEVWLTEAHARADRAVRAQRADTVHPASPAAHGTRGSSRRRHKYRVIAVMRNLALMR